MSPIRWVAIIVVTIFWIGICISVLHNEGKRHQAVTQNK